jgi:hypothetical protein
MLCAFLKKILSNFKTLQTLFLREARWALEFDGTCMNNDEPQIFYPVCVSVYSTRFSSSTSYAKARCTPVEVAAFRTLIGQWFHYQTETLVPVVPASFVFLPIHFEFRTSSLCSPISSFPDPDSFRPFHTSSDILSSPTILEEPIIPSTIFYTPKMNETIANIMGRLEQTSSEATIDNEIDTGVLDDPNGAIGSSENSTMAPTLEPTILNAEELHEYDAYAAVFLNVILIICVLLAYVIKEKRIYFLPER